MNQKYKQTKKPLRNKRPNLHNLWGNNRQITDNIFQWHFHMFWELEDGVVFPNKL